MLRRELMDILAGQNADPLFVEAALEADPRVIANIGPALRKHLESAAVQSKFGAEIEKLDEIDRAIETTSRALQVAEENNAREIKGEGAEPTRTSPSLRGGILSLVPGCAHIGP
jgi:hypothetical protein